MANKYSDNWKNSWNPEDWQGRTKLKVEYSHLIVGISLTIFVLYLLSRIFI
jgi:hypothetical protein